MKDMALTIPGDVLAVARIPRAWMETELKKNSPFSFIVRESCLVSELAKSQASRRPSSTISSVNAESRSSTMSMTTIKT